MKSITLKQAVIIAVICKFLAVMMLRASVASTTNKNMIDGDICADDSHILVFGMRTALVSVLFMMGVVDFFLLPVSTPHTITGPLPGQHCGQGLWVRDLVRVDQICVWTIH
jgi:phosphate/sulfate permease